MEVSRSSGALFGRLWEAYGQGRLDDVLHLIDRDCELRASVSNRVYCGHDGVRASMADFRRGWKSAILSSDEIVEVGAETVVVSGHLTAFDHSGKRAYDAPLAWVAEFYEGRLLRVTSFATAAEALDAATQARRSAE